MAYLRCKDKRYLLPIIFEREKGKCFYCDQEVLFSNRKDCAGRTKFDAATLDHIIPKSNKNSTGWILNLVLACYKCNHERGPTSAESFLLKKMMEKTK